MPPRPPHMAPARWPALLLLAERARNVADLMQALGLTRDGAGALLGRMVADGDAERTSRGWYALGASPRAAEAMRVWHHQRLWSDVQSLLRLNVRWAALERAQLRRWGETLDTVQRHERTAHDAAA